MSGSTISNPTGNPLSQGGGDTSSWSSDPLSTWLMQQRQAQLRAQPFNLTSFSQAPTLSWQNQPNDWTSRLPPGSPNADPGMVVQPYANPGYAMPNAFVGNLNQAPGQTVGGTLPANALQPQQPSQQQQQWQQQQAAQQQWMQQQMAAQQQAMQPWQRQYANVAAAYGIPVNQQWLQGAGAAPGYPRDGTG